MEREGKKAKEKEGSTEDGKGKGRQEISPHGHF